MGPKRRWGGQLAKVTPEQVRAIRERYSSGTVTQKALAVEYGVAQSQIGAIVRRTAWGHVP